MRIPDSLEWLRASEEGRAWLHRLPSLFEEAIDRWSLRTGDPYPSAFASLAVPVVLPDGAEAVLKLAFPHRESRHEADAPPEGWRRGGAALRARPKHGALLVRL